MEGGCVTDRSREDSQTFRPLSLLFLKILSHSRIDTLNTDTFERESAL